MGHQNQVGECIHAVTGSYLSRNLIVATDSRIAMPAFEPCGEQAILIRLCASPIPTPFSPSPNKSFRNSLCQSEALSVTPDRNPPGTTRNPSLDSPAGGKIPAGRSVGHPSLISIIVGKELPYVVLA